MYSVNVRDHVMIAHSFKGELFGPAQKLHGATYVVDVEFRADALGPEGVVVDIGRAHQALSRVLEPLKFQNLDDLENFRGQNTTTEVMARHVFDCVAKEIKAGTLGSGSDALSSLKVTLHESHIAWAAYEGKV